MEKGSISLRAALAVAAMLLLAHCGLGSAGKVPDYVLHVTLPQAGGQIGLPRIEGPADASRPLVVLDAGHGGHDPGASGPGSLREKNVTLTLVLALRDALLKDGRVRVALTRSDDRYLMLEERSGIARRLGADLFVSIHADSSENDTASGATIYTLSNRASDAVAANLAARENRSDTINGVSLGEKPDSVSSILVDLSRRETARESQAFSDLVLREARDAIEFHTNPQRRAAFVVLKSLDLPSALVEAGYISNPADAKKLTDPAWRKRFAAALAKAIEIFLAKKAATGV